MILVLSGHLVTPSNQALKAPSLDALMPPDTCFICVCSSSQAAKSCVLEDQVSPVSLYLQTSIQKASFDLSL